VPRNFKGKRFYVYILASLSGSLYIGITKNLARRVYDHKEGVISSFTAKYKINRLVYFETFQYVGNAIAREKEPKGWLRAKKIKLIESVNPSWRDLSRDWEREFKGPTVQ
jgi:putative endonuclease